MYRFSVEKNNKFRTTHLHRGQIAVKTEKKKFISIINKILVNKANRDKLNKNTFFLKDTVFCNLYCKNTVLLVTVHKQK